MPLGNDRFRQQIERALGRTIGQARRGVGVRLYGRCRNANDPQLSPTPFTFHRKIPNGIFALAFLSLGEQLF